MPKRAEKVRVNTYLPVSLVERIDREAELMGTSRSGIITQRLMQLYHELDSQAAINDGIKALSGMDIDELSQKVLTDMLKSSKAKAKR